MQCDSAFEVWRCVEEYGHKGLHESYAVSMARILWTHDFMIALCLQPKNPKPSLRQARGIARRERIEERSRHGEDAARER